MAVPSGETTAHDLRVRVVSAVRERVVDVPEESERFLDAPNVDRYLTANNMNVDRAAGQLLSTIRWRATNRPHQCVCRLCLEDPTSHSLRAVGVDAEGRIVIYACYATAMRRFNPHANLTHLTRLLEDCQRAMDSHPKLLAPKWVIIIDLHGYSLRDNDPRAAVNAMLMMQHYPERLGLGIIVGAAHLFNRLFGLIRPFLDPNTAKKIAMADHATLHEDPNAQRLGQDMLNWLRREMMYNRTEDGDMPAKRWWEPLPETSSWHPHDPRGLAAFVGSPFITHFHSYAPDSGTVDEEGERFEDAREFLD